MLVIFSPALVALIGMLGLVIDGWDTSLQGRDEQNVAQTASVCGG